MKRLVVALFDFQTFTGYNQTARFISMSKIFLWKNSLNTDDKIFKTLGDLGKNCLLKVLCILSFSKTCIFF